jgi:hypothetical protein
LLLLHTEEIQARIVKKIGEVFVDFFIKGLARNAVNAHK